MSRLKNSAVAVLAGWTIHLAFPGTGWWFAAPIGLALLWTALEKASVWGGFGLGFLAGMGFFLPLIRWTSVGVGPIPWVALSALEASLIALGTAAWAWARKRKLVRGRLWFEPLVFASLWASAEQLRSMIPWGGFPWGRLAFSQVDGPMAGLARIGGAPVVTLVVAVAGGCLGLAFEAARGRRVLIPAGASLAAVGVALMGILVPIDAAPESGTLRLAVAQGSVPNLGLDALSQARLVLANHVAATEVLAENLPWTPDVVVWPENAADYDPRVDARSRDAVTASARLVGSPLLLGTMDYTPEVGRYNVSLLWSEDGAVLDLYHKRHPVPFAEYIPIRSFARFFSSAVDRVTTDMLPGEEPGILALPSTRLGREVPIAVVICFEVGYDGLVRDAISGGGEVLVVQTNNANFGMTPESEQQLEMTRFRAIETGRSAIQASTVGVSAIVSPDGEILSRTRLFAAGYLIEEVPLRTFKTPATVLGGYLEWIVLCAPFAVAMVAGVWSLRGRWEWE